MILRVLTAVISVLLSGACAAVARTASAPSQQHYRLFDVEPDVHGTAQICFPVMMSTADDPEELTERDDCLKVGQLRFLLYGDLDLLEDDAKTWIDRLRAQTRPGDQ